MYRTVTAGGVAAALMLVSGCSSGSATSEWTSGADVLAGLADAGITCSWQGSEPQMSSIDTSSGTGTVVRCDDFSVILVSSVEDEVTAAQATTSCQDVTANVAQTPEAQTLIVTGANVVARPEGTQWPSDVSAQSVAAALDGEVVTALDVYQQVCPDISVEGQDDDSRSWLRTVRNVAITAAFFALVFGLDNADEADTPAAVEEPAPKESKESKDDKPGKDKSDDKPSKDDKPAEPAPPSKDEPSVNPGNWLEEQLTAIRDWFTSVVG
jgi:hypothetical protein